MVTRGKLRWLPTNFLSRTLCAVPYRAYDEIVSHIISEYDHAPDRPVRGH